MWWEELVAAKESFEYCSISLGMGDESSVPYIHVLLAQTECLRGRFDVAATHADEGVVRAEQVGQATLVAYALALRALAAAYRGDEETARAAAAAALELAGRRAAARPSSSRRLRSACWSSRSSATTPRRRCSAARRLCARARDA